MTWAVKTHTIEEVFPEVRTNKGGVVLRGSRYKDNLTQERLSQMTGIPRPHISGMERGARPIGKENARKLATALNCDYRLFLQSHFFCQSHHTKKIVTRFTGTVR